MKKIILSFISMLLIMGAFSYSYAADSVNNSYEIKLTNLPEEIVHQIIASVSEEKSLKEAVEKFYNLKIVNRAFRNIINNKFTLGLFVENCKKRFGAECFQKLCQEYLVDRIKNADKLDFLLSLNKLAKHKFIDINLLEIRLNSKESILREVEIFKQIAKKNGYLSLICTNNNAIESWLEDFGNMRLIDLSVILFDIDQIKMLIKNGADINAKNDKGNTALFILMYLNPEMLAHNLAETNFDSYFKLYSEFKPKYDEMLNFLLKNGTDIHIKNNDGMTSLMAVIPIGSIETVKLLLEKGADINAKNNDGITALMIAVMSRDVDVVKLLLEKGADVNATGDNSSTTAASIAAAILNHEILDLLFQYGAER